jgi:hypothetical protein
VNAQTLQAALALLLWIPIVLYLFTRYPVSRAALYSFLGGMMFLPERAWIKFPSFPELTKDALTNILMGIGLLIAGSRAKGKVEAWWYPVAAATIALGIATAITNPEPLYYGSFMVKGMTVRDGIYSGLNIFINSTLAAYIAMRCFSHERDLYRWLKVLAAAGVVYAIPILIELRFSPQMHQWIYGYPASLQFDQTIRFGGYRPMAMMTHGLALSLFMLGPTLAAFALARDKRERIWKFSARHVSLALLLLLILCKSTAVWVYAMVAIPLVRYGSVKLMMRTAVVLALVVCLYPYLRAVDKFPTETVLELSAKIDQDRRESMKFRFDNEDVLIEHAMKKPWLGWSTVYGRHMLYDEGGGLMTVTDGGWIISLGNGGIIGLALFNVIPVMGIITVARRLRRIRDPKQRTMLAALALYLSLCWVDVLPNGSFNLMPQFLSGALCAISGALARQKRGQVTRQQPLPARPEKPLSQPVPAPTSAA